MVSRSWQNGIVMDIDIDFLSRKDALSVIKCIPATIIREGKRSKHPSGVYVQDVPVDPDTGFASIPHDEMPECYFKLDLLNNSIYDGVIDEDHLVELMDKEPDWELLRYKEIVSTLPHIHSQYHIVDMIRPKSVEDLAVVLALMRPAKRHLIGKSREEINRHIWDKSDDQYGFKKAHAIAYAVSIVVKMNIMVEEITTELESDLYITF